jgi:hypothetical protein
MWQHIVNVVQSASAFLQKGKAPDNCPPELRKAMEDANHFSSKKFFIIFTSVLMVAFVYYSSIFILFLFPKEFGTHIAAYVTIFSETMKIFGLIIATYLGVQTVADFSFNSSSSASIEGEAQSETSISEENKNVNLNENILTNNSKEDDYNISEVEV